MEKKAICLIALLLLTVPSYCDDNTVDGNGLTATASMDPFKDVLNLKVKELNLSITPEFKIVLPDASVYVGLKQKLGDTQLEGATEYNYISNKIKYMIMYGLELYLPVSVRLYDNIAFQQVYAEKRYIERSKGLGISVDSPKIFDIFAVREEFKNEDIYYAELNNAYVPSQGIVTSLNTKFEIGIKETYGIDGAEKKYDRLNIKFDFEKAIPHAYSATNYLFVTGNLLGNRKFSATDNLEFRVETGYLLEAQNVPLTKMYKIGGFDRLIGWGIDEFQGYYKLFGRIRYDFSLAESINREIWWMRLDAVKPFFMADAGKVGNVHEVQCTGNYKFGIGAGAILQFTYRKRAPIKVALGIGQPLYSGRPPVFYFIYEML
ncbi:MAG: hypothetical protein LLG37_00180 [Spirochaetia bacterium]|nr:hypothetical protein [Spirochaetia bacterium]